MLSILRNGSIKPVQILFLTTFFLEFAAYLPLPYLSIHLRDRLHISESILGIILSTSIWFRPFCTLLSRYLNKFFHIETLMKFALLILSSSYLVLSFADSIYSVIPFLLLANLGMSIWNPSVYSLVYNFSTNSSEESRNLARLNTFLYSGAASASLLASVFSSTNTYYLFWIGSIVFGFALFSIKPLYRYHNQEHKKQKDEKISKFNWKQLPMRQFLAVSLVTILYWAFYNQFNSFFSLLAQDWLKKPGLAGLVFALLTLLVVAFSFLLSKYDIAFRYKLLVLIGTVVILMGSFLSILALDNEPAIYIFIIALALSEALMVPLLSQFWNSLAPSQAFQAQSINYGLCNIGMGLGTVIGGYFYSNESRHHLIFNYGGENLLLLTLVLTIILIFYFRTKKGNSSI